MASFGRDSLPRRARELPDRATGRGVGDSELTLLEIPAPVRRFVLPVQVMLGRLRGRYAKYADAPDPVARR